jgi:hypothetical protein
LFILVTTEVSTKLDKFLEFINSVLPFSLLNNLSKGISDFPSKATQVIDVFIKSIDNISLAIDEYNNFAGKSVEGTRSGNVYSITNFDENDYDSFSKHYENIVNGTITKTNFLTNRHSFLKFLQDLNSTLLNVICSVNSFFFFFFCSFYVFVIYFILDFSENFLIIPIEEFNMSEIIEKLESLDELIGFHFLNDYDEKFF